MPVDELRDRLETALGSGYCIGRELGGGGMSRVFVAEDVRLRRRIVAKVLSPELAAGISAERFEREIQLAAALQQANIVPLTPETLRDDDRARASHARPPPHWDYPKRGRGSHCRRWQSYRRNRSIGRQR